MQAFEKELAFHCAPALAGIKAANLICCAKEDYDSFEELIAQYNAQLNRCGICFEILSQCSKKHLLLVYRPKLLERHVSLPVCRQILSAAGYPAAAPLPGLLKHLKGRLTNCEEFPHEIGVFLGYPPEDVIGFQLHRGKGYKLCGYWKVYSDPELAEKAFRCYDRCRSALYRRVSSGYTLTKLFLAA